MWANAVNDEADGSEWDLTKPVRTPEGRVDREIEVGRIRGRRGSELAGGVGWSTKVILGAV